MGAYAVLFEQDWTIRAKYSIDSNLNGVPVGSPAVAKMAATLHTPIAPAQVTNLKTAPAPPLVFDARH